MKHILVSMFLLSCTNDVLHKTCPHRCYGIPGTSPDVYLYSDEKILARTKGVGVCREGYSICDENMNIVECVGEVLPSLEKCDGLDNDCDGKVDNNIYLDAWSVNYSCLRYGVCSSTIAICVNGLFMCQYPDTYEAEETRCDGLDNDCDGRIDEDLFFGQYCYEGPIGTEWNPPCHPGALRCINGNTMCENQILPVVELCDGVDNDCDGIIDNVEGETPEKYDMVFVVDTSGSMCLYISAVSGALDAYAQQFDGNANYKFALVIMSYNFAPYVRVDTNFSDFSTIRNRLLSLGCSGGGSEASLDSMHMVCDLNNPLSLNWRSDANRLFFAFTDEPAQTHRHPNGLSWCFNCGMTTEQDIVTVCLQSYTLPFVWGRYNDSKFIYIVQNANGAYFNLTSSWRQIFNELNGVIASFCN